ncbi:DUF6379 domain-containing protein [Actinotalea sp. M2MS4P-6]|uniref:C-glycoside deglycosidase beta subunit domain-containing protein n=1 Tax=Actinotalea sp. M2MS4P-6 TaxID=2983762 RepID=UPI0021E4BD60|nr:DUF6379 domain-containing protein [Actinotalea sp. M2MS4P-6]MCV2394379.1 DUF6379 domain-containing protein [Actinotalea sp. M2MS4P-6]
MFDSYVIGEGTVRNVTEGDETVGFAFDSRIAYYRGLGVSMVEPFEITVDGEAVPTDALRFSLGDRTWTFDELETDYDTRWELTDTATVTVLRPGGLRGEHTVEAIEVLRISYLPFPSRTRCARTVTLD